MSDILSTHSHARPFGRSEEKDKEEPYHVQLCRSVDRIMVMLKGPPPLLRRRRSCGPHAAGYQIKDNTQTRPPPFYLTAAKVSASSLSELCAIKGGKAWECVDRISDNICSPPLVYQSTTSLGLGQVQMPRPKEVMATGAAARGSKKWYNFFAEIKSSSPVKYEHIHPLWNYLRIQSFEFGTNLVSARWILERASTSIQTFCSD